MEEFTSGEEGTAAWCLVRAGGLTGWLLPQGTRSTVGLWVSRLHSLLCVPNPAPDPCPQGHV